MQRVSGCARRSLLGGVLVSVISAVAGVASAGATITQTAITSPSSPYIYQFNNDLSPAPTQTITGTTNSTAPGTDKVDINCYYNSQGTLRDSSVASGVTTDASGGFSYQGPVDIGHGSTCQLRAVPAGFNTSGPVGPFAPLGAQLDHFGTSQLNGSGTPTYDFYYTATGTQAYDEYDSVGSCGLDWSYPVQGFTHLDGGTWDCAGGLYGHDGSNRRSEIVIDGTKNAYDAASAYDPSSTGGAWYDRTLGPPTGFPALTSSYSKDASTGNVTITESEPLVSCADASYPATETKCGGTAGATNGTWQSDGVSFARKIVQTDGGQIATMTDTYTSTDSAAHTLDLEYDNYLWEDSDTPVWKLPGSTSWQTYTSGDSSTLSGKSLGVIEGADGYAPDANYYDGPGALIYTTQPSSATFTSIQDLLLDYKLSVPAGGSVSLTQTYVTAVDTTALQTAVNSIVDQSVKPTVTISSPASGTKTANSSVQVSGTASAHDGLALKVNGEAVGVNPDGTWSTAVALNQGSNTITATASDGSGNTVSAATTVVYAPPTIPTVTLPTYCIVPNVSRMTLANAKAALAAAHCGVGAISKVKSKTYKKGTIEHASSATGTVLVSGTKIGLTESTGKPAKKHKKHKKHKHHKKSTRHGKKK